MEQQQCVLVNLSDFQEVDVSTMLECNLYEPSCSFQLEEQFPANEDCEISVNDECTVYTNGDHSHQSTVLALEQQEQTDLQSTQVLPTVRTPLSQSTEKRRNYRKILPLLQDNADFPQSTQPRQILNPAQTPILHSGKRRSYKNSPLLLSQELKISRQSNHVLPTAQMPLSQYLDNLSEDSRFLQETFPDSDWFCRHTANKLCYILVQDCREMIRLEVYVVTGVYTVSGLGRPVSSNFFTIKKEIPMLETAGDLQTVFKRLGQYKVCAGNDDPQFLEYCKLSPIENICICSKTNSLRSSNCSILVTPQHRCAECTKQRDVLWEHMKRKQTPRVTDKRCHNPLTAKELRDPYAPNERESKCDNLNVVRVKKGIEKLNAMFHNEQATTDNRAMQFFFKEQIKSLQAKSRSGVRWHPLFLKWCMYIHAKSPQTYKAIRESGFMHLPSRQALSAAMSLSRQPPTFTFSASDLSVLYGTPSSADIDSETLSQLKSAPERST